MMAFAKFLWCILCLSLSGCISIPSPQIRTQNADEIAQHAKFKKHIIQTSVFNLQAYGSNTSTKNHVLTIYIEGDGLAWLSENQPSNNPTPIVPTGLKMAIHNQKNHPVAYLARPCQFIFKNSWKNCTQAYWTNLRFAPEVLHAMNQAVTYLKNYYHAKQIILIGYSGGGTIATLIASERSDVIKLITMAAILDIKKWTNQEHLTPLTGSLNPADRWQKLKSIPQTHWIGGKDLVVRKEVALAFAKRFSKQNQPQIITIHNFDHKCCWDHIKIS